MLRHRSSLALLAAWLALPPSPAAGQPVPAQKPAPAVAPAAAATAPAVPALPEADTYTYDSHGRRDPFVSLLARGTDSKSLQARKADGIGGLSVGELTVRGILKSREGFVAMLQGPDHKTYVARPGDRLADGTIRAITEQGLVILQEVNDPLSLVKQKEVRKGLRAFDEGK